MFLPLRPPPPSQLSFPNGPAEGRGGLGGQIAASDIRGCSERGSGKRKGEAFGTFWDTEKGTEECEVVQS